MLEYLNKLNENQLRPVLDTEGAVLVTAGAGSGKTRVLTSRIAYLVNEMGVYPYNILAITFTNKAANEMKERLSSMIDGAEKMWVCTIHRMCVQILRYFGDKIGYNDRFTIYSENERDRVLKLLFTKFGYDDDKITKNVKFHIGRAKMLGEPCEEYVLKNAGSKYMNETEKVYSAYEEELKKSNALDFDDLLIKAYELLSSNREALDYYANKFRYIHVDEFQDTNKLQYNIIKLLTEKHGNIFIVGDEDQSIYGWRGADIANIMGFERDFPGARVYKLEQNYRSSKSILDVANYIIKNNTLRRDKRLWTDSDGGEKVEFYEASDENNEALLTATIIKNKIASGARPSDFAVLMRVNALSRAYEQEFLKYSIPNKIYGGFKFYERKEIKDITAYLRLLNNKNDNDALLRVINVPKRGIGEKTISVLIEYAAQYNVSLYDVVVGGVPPLTPAAANKLAVFRDTMISLSEKAEGLNVYQLTKEIIRITDFLSVYQSPSPENDDKKRNIDEFLASVYDFAEKNKDAGLSEYLNTITLSSDTDAINETDCVTIATIHAVKGLEYKTVFLCGLDETILPISRAVNSDNELEEERRLMYVAITRAREKLYLTRAKSRFLYGDRQSTMRSRFLNELAGIIDLGDDKKSGYEGYQSTQGQGRMYGNRQSYSNQGYGSRQGGYSSNYSGGYKSGGDSASFNYEDVMGSKAASAKGGASANLLGGYRSSAPKAEKRDTGAYLPGARIEHAKFGEGRIVAVKGSGANTIADVAFKNYGVKQLSVSLAPIKIIEG